MTRVLPISLSLIVFFFVVFPADAQTVTPATTISPLKADRVTAKTTTTDVKNAQITSLQERASKEIDRRIAALTLILTKISEMKKLPTAEKTALTTQVQAEITSLTALKAKITGATELVPLKADIALIVTNYRVFALFIPKIHLLAGADVLGRTIDSLTLVSTKLDARIKEAEAAGKVVTNLTKTHTEMVQSLAEAKKQYESILTNVSPLKPEEYPANKTTLTNARQLLKTGRSNVNDAAKNAHYIITALKAFRPALSAEASGSATPVANQ